MGLHLHRILTTIVIVSLLLMPVSAPAAFGAEDSPGAVQETQQKEEAAPAKEETTTKAAESPTQAAEPEPEKTEETKDVSREPASGEGATEETSTKEASAETLIQITFSLMVDKEKGDEWVKPQTLSFAEDSTVKEVLESVLKELDGKCECSKEGKIQSITFPTEKDAITLRAAEETGKWIYSINGKDFETGADKYVLKDKDKLVVYYKPVESVTDETANAETAVPEETADSMHIDTDTLLQGTSVSGGKSVDHAYGNTKGIITEIGNQNHWSADTIWMVLGLARAGELTSSQAKAYYGDILAKMEKINSPVLSPKQSSDNSRAVLALTAAGYDASDVGGYNLLEPLANMSYIRAQGMNGPVWALLAFDSKGYEIPKLTGVSESAAEKLQTTREKLVQTLLGSRKSDGGWAFSGNRSDVDMTAMTIQALAPYYNTDPKVKTAVDGALNWLSAAQNKDGSFSSGDSVNSESSSQVIVALTSLGIDPGKDKRFLKNGKGAVDSLLSFYTKGGGFKHIKDNYKYNVLATYQGYYALVAYYRSLNGKNSLYDMSDAGDDFIIDVEYIIDQVAKDREAAQQKAKNQAAEAEKAAEKKQEEQKPLGATKGITKSAGLIKLKGATAEAKGSIGLIEAVVNRGLSEDVASYTEEDIKAINEAYRAYLKLEPAEKLAVEKDKNWKSFCKLTKALGSLYHIDPEHGVDVLDNNDIIMPWYVKLVVTEQDITKEQSDKIISILGEKGRIFETYDISFVDTLAGDDPENPEADNHWSPEKVLKVNLGIPAELENTPVVVHITKKGKIEFLANKVIKDKDNRYQGYRRYAQFKSDDFSIYGIAGTADSIRSMISEPEEASSGTDGMLWVYLGAAALAALALVAVLRRRTGAAEETKES